MLTLSLSVHRSRKYLFGSMGVYGKANDSLITCVLLLSLLLRPC